MDGQKRSSRWPLVGREKEMAAFEQGWADRRCHGVVVCGPAGVGKSRLAAGYLARAVGQGFKGGRATASTAAATVPLGAIAHLVPAEVDLSDPVEGFEQIAAALAGPQRHRWAVLVDDLHLLDATSAVLLGHLLEAGTVRLIGTVRSGEPLGEAVGALIDSDAVTRIDLAEFDEGTTDRLLRTALGGPVGHRTLRHLHTVSKGNVLYLQELVIGALRAGTLAGDGKIWELSPDAPMGTPKLAELIKARLLTADPAAPPILEMLALCGPVPLADAQAAASPDVLSGLERVGLVQVTNARRRTLTQLAHPLYGEVLRADIPTMRRRTTLLRQADRTQAHGARRRDDVLRIAMWRLAATGTADHALLVQAATLARHAHDYRQVIALLRALPEQYHTTSTRLLLGEAHSTLHELEEAEEVFSLACEAAESEAERIIIIRARSLNLLMNGHKAEALKVNSWGREGTESEIGKKALQVNEGSIRCLSGEPASGFRLLEALDDLELHMESWHLLDVWLAGASFKTFTLSCIGQACRAVEFGEKVHATHLHMDEKALFQHPAAQLNVLTVALGEAGDLRHARSTGLEAVSQTVSAKAPVNYLWASFFTGRNELVSGHLGEARDLCAEAAAEAHTQNVVLATRLIDSVLAAVHAQLGDVPAAQAVVAESSHHPAMGMLTGEERLGEAWIHAARGDLARARAVLTAAAASAREAGHVASEALLLTDVARLGGASEAAGRLAELAGACEGTLAPARARLAAALADGDPDRLLASAEELEALGADLLAAEAATAAAAAWIRVGQARRAADATERAAACGARCRGARTPLLATAQATAPLTTREREIALLAAAGTSSRDIAETLHLSARTVNNHLQHAYTKLGVTTRRALADILG